MPDQAPAGTGHEADGRLGPSGSFWLLRGHRRRVDRDRGLGRRCRLGFDPDLERRGGRCLSDQEHVRRDVSVGRDGGRGQGERRLLGSDHHRDRATLRLFLGDDLASERRERWHLEQSEPDPSVIEIVRAQAVEQATTGDGAHLVIELRPAHASAVVAEADEVDRVRVGDSRGGGTWIHRWRALPSCRPRDCQDGQAGALGDVGNDDARAGRSTLRVRRRASVTDATGRLFAGGQSTGRRTS